MNNNELTKHAKYAASPVWQKVLSFALVIAFVISLDGAGAIAAEVTEELAGTGRAVQEEKAADESWLTSVREEAEQDVPDPEASAGEDGFAADEDTGNAEYDFTKAEIVKEIPELREENVKHYLMDDGAFVAEVYDYPIHIEDGGEWRDIDNTLEERDGTYQPRFSDKPIELPTELNAEARVKYSAPGYPISWKYEGIFKEEPVREAAATTTPDPENTAAPATETPTPAPDATPEETAASAPKAEAESREAPAPTGDDALTLPKTDEKAGSGDVISVREGLFEQAELEVKPAEEPNKKGVEKLTGEARFQAGLVTLDYIVTPSGLKENLIIKELGASDGYAVVYDAPGLFAVQADDSTVIFTNAGGEIIYTVTAPSMYDANGDVSEKLQLVLEILGEGSFRVAVVPDKEWLENAAYPVVVDPEIVNNNTSGNITSNSNFTRISGTGALSTGHVYVGRLTYTPNNEVVARTTVKLNTLPSLPTDAMVVGGNIVLYQQDYSAASLTSMNIYMYMATGERSTTQSVQTPYAPAILDYGTASAATSLSATVYNITEPLRQWYAYSNTNFGLVFASGQEDTRARVGIVHSTDPTVANRPVIQIAYRSFAGTESYWSFTSFAAGTRGVGMVNNYTGGFVYTENVLSMTGARMPISLSLTYNNVYYQKTGYAQGGAYGVDVGKGWTLSVAQTLRQILSTDALYARGYRYTYFDADGTLHYFLASGNEIIDEDGLGLNVIIVPSNYGLRRIVDKGGNVLEFSGNSTQTEFSGALTGIYDSNYTGAVSAGTLAGSPNKISISQGISMQDPSGRAVTFTKTNGRITQISAEGQTVTLTYTDSGALTRITYSDGLYTQFNYDAQGRLLRISTNLGANSATGDNGSSVEILYSGTTSALQSFYKVSKIAEYQKLVPATAEEGGYLTFNYLGQNTTVITDRKNRSEQWNFDTYGRVTSVLGADGSSAGASYAANAGTSKSANKMTSVFAAEKFVVNLLQNGGAEDGIPSSFWVGGVGGTTTITADTTQKSLGAKSFKLTKTAETTGQLLLRGPIIAVTPGKYYTFSADLRIDGTISANGARVALNYLNGSTTLNSTGSDIKLTTGNDWVRISVSVLAPANATAVGAFCILNVNGTAYFDNLQLEEGPVPNAYNLVENSDFRYAVAGTPNGAVSWERQFLESSDYNTGSAYRIQGNPDNEKEIYQYVKINKVNPQIALTIKAKADSTPLVKSDRSFSGYIGFYFADGTATEWKRFDFNPFVRAS
ncbi:MAG: DUF6531 domain-containing protein [Oscillospiraceae bacterium]|nr:DUF6531 domain-containing protein [Oscillospiraceae bacterium]